MLDGADTSNAADGTFHNWVFRMSADGGAIALFYDGVLGDTDVTGLTMSGSDQPLKVGYAGAGAPLSVSDIATWSRPLTDEEITTLYNGGVPFRPT